MKKPLFLLSLNLIFLSSCSEKGDKAAQELSLIMPDLQIETIQEDSLTHCLAIIDTVDYMDEGTIHDKWFGQLAKFMDSSGILAAGPKYSTYHHVGENSSVIEVGFPVGIEEFIDLPEPFSYSHLDTGRVVVALHKGDYDGISASVDYINDWMKNQGHKPKGLYSEIYFRDAWNEPDQKKWETLIYVPIF